MDAVFVRRHQVAMAATFCKIRSLHVTSDKERELLRNIHMTGKCIHYVNGPALASVLNSWGGWLTTVFSHVTVEEHVCYKKRTDLMNISLACYLHDKYGYKIEKKEIYISIHNMYLNIHLKNPHTIRRIYSHNLINDYFNQYGRRAYYNYHLRYMVAGVDDIPAWQWRLCMNLLKRIEKV